MVRQRHLIESRVLTAVVGAFLIGCAVLMVFGCSAGRSEAPQEEQGQTEATKEKQGRSSEEAHCGGTRTVDLLKSAGVDYISDSSVQPGDPEARFITNDRPGCPNGGLLSGTDKSDRLAGEEGEDEVRGLGAADDLSGGRGRDAVYGESGNDELQGGGSQPLSFYTDRSKNALYGGPGKDFLAGGEGDDVIYGGEGDDEMLWGGGGEDVLHGEDGNDYLDATDGRRDKLYCGEGKDRYLASKLDYVSSSCEVDHDSAGD